MKKRVVTNIRLSEDLLYDLRAMAISEGVSTNTLMLGWLRELHEHQQRRLKGKARHKDRT